jgi:hypothetical protein
MLGLPYTRQELCRKRTQAARNKAAAMMGTLACANVKVPVFGVPAAWDVV